MARRLELGAIVGLHHVHAEGQAAEDFVDQEPGRAVVAGLLDFTMRIRVQSLTAALAPKAMMLLHRVVSTGT